MAFADPDLRVHLRHRRDDHLGAHPDPAARREVRAASADLQLLAEGDAFTGLALMLLVLRSFTQGAAALTGVEAISNGVPAFRKPKSRNAATTLLLLGGHLGGDVLRADRARPADRGEDRGVPGAAVRRRAAGLHPADAGRAARRRRVRRLPARASSSWSSDGADPGAGRQHRLQRLPGARLDPVAGPLPAPPAAHPRRPAGVLQRHPRARRRSRSCWSSASRPRSPG